jgi:predicted nucleic acid-binding protein
VKYLLDVNVLVALGFDRHEFHDHSANWIRSLRAAGIPDLATCSIVELGFVRVLSQTQAYGFTVAQAELLLSRTKSMDVAKFEFIADNLGASDLPGWVKLAKQITDGHLVELAKANGAILATLDERIPGAFAIPGRR